MEPLPGAGPLPPPLPPGLPGGPAAPPGGGQVPVDELVALVAQFVARTEAEVVAALCRRPADGGRPLPPPELVRAVRDALAALAARSGRVYTPEALERAVQAVVARMYPGGTVVLPPGARPLPVAPDRPDAPRPAPARPAGPDVPTPVTRLPGATPPGAPRPGAVPPGPARPGTSLPAPALPSLAAALPALLAELGCDAEALVGHLQAGGTLQQLARQAGLAPGRLEALLRPAVAAGAADGWDAQVVDQVVAATAAAHGPQPLPVAGGSLLAAAEEVLRARRPLRRDDDGAEERRPPRQPDGRGDDEDGRGGEEGPDDGPGGDVPGTLRDFVGGAPER